MAEMRISPFGFCGLGQPAFKLIDLNHLSFDFTLNMFLSRFLGACLNALFSMAQAKICLPDNAEMEISSFGFLSTKHPLLPLGYVNHPSRLFKNVLNHVSKRVLKSFKLPLIGYWKIRLSVS